LTFILVLLLFDVDGEWRRLVPGLEADVCRSLIQAVMGRQIAHPKKKFELEVIGVRRGKKESHG